MPRTYPSARERILDATERLLLREGLGGVGVEAVLAEAGVSKGGFFHHFATKDALLGAVTERLARHAAERVDELAQAEPRAMGRSVRAQIELSLGMPRAERDRLQTLVIALIEGARGSPAIAAKARRDNRRALAAARAEGLSETSALVVQLALDGYWLATSLGTLSLGARQREDFRQALRALAGDDHG